MMKPTAVALLISVLVSGAAAGTLCWTEPAPVWPDTAGADTLWQYTPAFADADTALWLAWREKRGGAPAHIRVSRHDGRRWLTPHAVAAGDGVMSKSLALDRELNPWVVFDAYDPGTRQTRLLSFHRQRDTWAEPVVLFEDDPDWSLQPALAAHPQGGVQATWVLVGREAWLYTARGTADSWTTPVTIDTALGVMLPREHEIAALADSQLMVVWPAYREPDYCPLWSMVGSGEDWTAPTPVAPPPLLRDLYPRLAVTRTGEVRLFWYRSGEGIHTARYDGGQWYEHVFLDADMLYTPSVCTDEHGWIWTAFTRRFQDGGGTSYLRYHDGVDWSERLYLPFDSIYGISDIAAASGRIWLLMGEWEGTGARSLLYYSSAGHPLAVTESGQTPVRQPAGPTVVRGAFNLAGLGHDPDCRTIRSCPAPVLLDAAGRKVMELQPGDNDVRHLAPGVYFIRAEGPTAKVVIQR